ncbi:MAG: glycosyltransferase [Rhizobacter sp.]|nr:glycosyltransferase [Ferruginibacter sp.]
MMERTPLQPPVIPALPAGVKRPLWSVMIPAYNCGRYIQRTIESVLMQAPAEKLMQIEVVDDASTDIDLQSLVHKTGNGRVKYFRQVNNVGSLRNFETSINRARGHYVHILHGDDFLSPGFYDEAAMLFKQFPSAAAVFTAFTQVNEQGTFICNSEIPASQPGIIPGWLSIIARNQKLQPPAVVVKREVYEKLGSFFGVHYGEDWEMWVRIAARYPMAHSPKKLAHYRVHDENISSHSLVSGQHIKDIASVINTIQNYLPAPEKKIWMRAAKKNWSLYFARTADKTYGKYKQPRQALRQAKMAYQLHRNQVSFFYMAKTFVKLAIGWKVKDR